MYNNRILNTIAKRYKTKFEMFLNNHKLQMVYQRLYHILPFLSLILFKIIYKQSLIIQVLNFFTIIINFNIKNIVIYYNADINNYIFYK